MSFNPIFKGAAVKIGSHTFYINLSNHHRRRFAHELGHAKFSLEHPDGSGWGKEGLLDRMMEGEFDHENFMLSGPNTKMPEISFKIRPYHWKYIHSKF